MKRQAEAQQHQQAAASGSTALVVVKSREVARSLAALNFKFSKGSARSRGGDGQALAAGDAAGARVNLGAATRQIT